MAGVCMWEVWVCVWVGLLCTHFIVLPTAVHLRNKSLVGAQNLFVFLFFYLDVFEVSEANDHFSVLPG